MISTGYNINSNLANLNKEKIDEIEQYLNSNKNVIDNLDCCYSEVYKRMDIFRFLLGHKALILAIPDMVGVSKKEHSLSDQELKDDLIKKLIAATGKSGFCLPAGIISESNLLQFHRTMNERDTVCKCIFSCPFCSKKYTIKYKTFWITVNAWKHLRTAHIQNQ